MFLSNMFCKPCHQVKKLSMRAMERIKKFKPSRSDFIPKFFSRARSRTSTVSAEDPKIVAVNYDTTKTDRSPLTVAVAEPDDLGVLTSPLPTRQSPRLLRSPLPHKAWKASRVNRFGLKSPDAVAEYFKSVRGYHTKSDIKEWEEGRTQDGRRWSTHH